MQIKATAAAVAFALAAPAVANAEFNYSFIEGGFVDVELGTSGADLDGDGLRIEGAYEVGETFFVRAEYEDYDFDSDFDGHAFEIGFGYFHTLNDDIDFVATGQYIDTEVERGNFSADDDGIGIGGGIRARLSDAIDVDAMLNYYDYDNSGSDSSIDLRGRYYFSNTLAVYAKVELGNNELDSIGIGVRFDLAASSGN